MLPTFRQGQIIVCRHRTDELTIGDIVVFRHNNVDKIKRIARIEEQKVYVLGDNGQASSDSRHFGWLDREVVVGKIIWPKP
jgi:phage repressor protein C with HTH and peptisase S24 domain